MTVVDTVKPVEVAAVPVAGVVGIDEAEIITVVNGTKLVELDAFLVVEEFEGFTEVEVIKLVVNGIEVIKLDRFPVVEEFESFTGVERIKVVVNGIEVIELDRFPVMGESEDFTWVGGIEAEVDVLDSETVAIEDGFDVDETDEEVVLAGNEALIA
jgi:hypothetical protein